MMKHGIKQNKTKIEETLHIPVTKSTAHWDRRCGGTRCLDHSLITIAKVSKRGQLVPF